MSRGSKLSEGDVPRNIRGLELLEPIRTSRDSVVYRARRNGDVYEIRLYREMGSDEDVRQHLKRQAAVHASLRHPLVPTSYDAGIVEGRPYMVTELVEGRSLRADLEEGPLPESFVVALADAIAGALAQLHDRGLVHDNLGPSSVRWTKDGGLKLVDFHLVGRETTRSDASWNGRFEEGYLAPEQTGLLETPVDDRTDLYALGALLFECQSGRSPFEIVETADVLGSHHAIAPPPLEEVCDDVSPALAAIVDKLLEGRPEDRYQSGRSLQADLQHLETFNQRVRAGLPLQLETTDPLVERRRNDEFVGRESEIETFRRAWHGAEQGDGGLVVVEGPAGSGKTRLLEEVCGDVVGDGLRVLSGRCGSSKPVPFAPLRSSLHGHLETIESLSPEERTRALEHLRDAAGDFEDVLAALSTKLRELFDVYDDVEIQREAHDVFYNALTTFYLELADRHGGLFLWLDDLQWLDNASRQVLDLLLPQLSDHHLLVACAMRTSPEVGGSNVRSFRERFSQVELAHVEMEPFDVSDVGAFISSELGERPFESSFIEDVASSSGGNPLFVQQSLRAMRDEGKLSPNWGTWKIEGDWEAISKQGEPFEALDRRTEAFDDDVRTILAIAASLGEVVELSMLEAVAESHERDALHRAIREAREAELLVPSLEDEAYLFTHDYVRRSFADDLSEARTDVVHRRAARYLDARGDLDRRAIYRRARHVCVGGAGDDPDLLARACLDAARCADREYAFEDAYDFLRELRAFDPSDLSIAAGAYYRLLGRACLRTDRFEEAIEHFQSALEYVENTLERARLRTGIAQAHIYGLNETSALEEAEQAFEELDVTMPSWRWSSTLPIAMAILWRWLVSMVVIWTGFGGGRASGRERLKYRLLVRLFDVGLHAGYYSRNLVFVLQSPIYALKPAHELGPSREFCLGYANYGALAASLGFEGIADRYGREALEAARELDDPQSSVLMRQMWGGIQSHAGNIHEAISNAEEILVDDSEWLDSRSLLVVCQDLTVNYAFLGRHHEIVPVARRGIRRFERRDGRVWNVYLALLYATATSAFAMLGRFERADTCYEKVVSLRSDIPDDRHVPEVRVWSELLNYHLQKRQWGDAFEGVVEAHRSFQIPPDRSTYHSKHFYLHHAYARLEIADRETNEARLEEARRACRSLRAAASTPILEQHHRVVHGALERLEGHLESASRTLQETTHSSRNANNGWVLFESLRQRALLERLEGRDDEAVQIARRAAGVAAELRWAGHVERLEETFGLDLSARTLET
jgi:tetratricopeptide (TPR) repeat protein